MKFVRNEKIKPHGNEQESGVYTCANCGKTLFDAKTKFTVGSGFPSFWEHVGDSVKQQALSTYNRDRIQLVCS